MRFNRRSYARQFKILHGTYERYAMPIFEKAMKRTLKMVADHVRKNDNVLLFGQAIDPSVMRLAYFKVWEYVGVAHAEFTYNWIERIANRKSISFHSDRWRKAMAEYYQMYGALRVAEVEETTLEDIQKLLIEAALQELTPSQTATFIADALENPDYTRMRTMRISRTESTTAANHGSQLAAEDSDYLCGKVWIPIVDKRTRKSHKDMANKEPIQLHNSFEVIITKGGKGKEVQVGVDYMQYPGDPTASAGNVVNCRCAHAVVPMADANGLPIMKMAA